MTCVVLVGDSIFDNKAYTNGGPDVTAHLQTMAPSRATVVRCAVDGTTTANVANQYPGIPSEASHVVLSLGGNDAILSADLLDSPVRSTGEAFDLFQRHLQPFEIAYRQAVARLVVPQRSLHVCTIYNGNLGGIDGGRAPTALALWNDVIWRTAQHFGVHVIELRHVCTEPTDFANPLEPSVIGGAKVASAIAVAVGWKVPRVSATHLTAL